MFILMKGYDNFCWLGKLYKGLISFFVIFALLHVQMVSPCLKLAQTKFCLKCNYFSHISLYIVPIYMLDT